ncbi:prolyl oligopeptidase family serine peptidase [Haloferula sp.]|uniref:prolyl oligopeptidase family serine peptidase n=1 Tax=Haloferula sp. TaxID=2497595 RepID=UPI00329ACF14
MPRILCLFFLFSILDGFSADEYPVSRQDDLIETLHGVEVADPYRWLEDDHSEDTKQWVKAQNRFTESHLSTFSGRDSIRQRLKALWNYERIGLPVEHGGRWFYKQNSGLQNQSVLMVADSLDANPRVLLDPNSLTADGTASLANWRPSEDGTKLVWSVSKGGSDWNEVFVRDVATGKDLDDHLKWVKFSLLSWTKDGEGFFYSRYDAPSEGAALTAKNEFQKLYYHKLGTPQSEDRLIYQRLDEPEWGFRGLVSEDGDYLLIHVFQGTSPTNRIFYRKVAGGEVIELLPKNDASYRFVGNVGPLLYFRTNLDAPRHRLISIDVRKPQRSHWKEILPESDALLAAASMVGNQIICRYLEHASSRIRCFDHDGKAIRTVELPGIGTADGFYGRKDDDFCFYSFTSFTDPGAIYRLDLKSGESTEWRRPKVDFDSSDFVVKQAFVPSKDKTKVPIFIIHKRGLKLDGSNRTLLYGYGGFNISQVPYFSVSRAVWIERGGVLVVANLRGGGEYGSKWHKSGTKLNKQNVFDDFIAASEWLIETQYTSSSKLAIQGGSNGGLLVGACMTQRPELFGACLPAVGVMDMLRFHKFTIGWAWEKEFGSPDDPQHFGNLRRYSPYHALKPGTRYPATLITTADHDDRVVPAHSFKFAARLQKCQAKNGPPVLIRIDTSAGHGAGTALDKVIDRVADQWAFLEENL